MTETAAETAVHPVMSEAVLIYVDAPVDQVVRALGDVMEAREREPEHGAVKRFEEVEHANGDTFGHIEVSFYTNHDWPPVLIRPAGGEPVDLTRFPMQLTVSPGYDEDDRMGAWAVFGSVASYGFRAVLTYDDRVVRAESYDAVTP